MENKKIIRILSGILTNEDNKKKLMDIMRVADINSINYHDVLTRSIETMSAIGLLDLADIDSKTSAPFRIGIFNAKKNGYAPSVTMEYFDKLLGELIRNPEYEPLVLVTVKSGSTAFNSIMKVSQLIQGNVDIRLYDVCSDVVTEPITLTVQEGFFDNTEKEAYLKMELNSDTFHKQLELNREAQTIVDSKIKEIFEAYIKFRKEFLCFN